MCISILSNSREKIYSSVVLPPCWLEKAIYRLSLLLVLLTPVCEKLGDYHPHIGHNEPQLSLRLLS